MLSLPIVLREFSLAARRKRTFWVRVLFAALLGLNALMFIFAAMTEPSNSAGGWEFFNVLSAQTFFATALVAPALIGGCISDERNDGTLGLLFLTRLNSADIVLGKLIGRGFDAFLLFLCAMPFLFVPILLGGVNWDQTLALAGQIVALLLLALAAGLFGSTVCRRTSSAWVLAYALLGVCVMLPLALPSLNRLLVSFGIRTLEFSIPPWVPLLSPARGIFSGAYRLSDSLWSLGGCTALAVTLLGYCIWRLPRTLNEDESRPGAWRRLLALAGARPRKRVHWLVRRASLERNPAYWLDAMRDTSWTIQMFLAGIALMGLIAGMMRDPLQSMEISFIAGWVCLVSAKLLITLTVSRGFITEKLDGTLELLLTTPLTETVIVGGKINAVFARYGLLALTGFGLVVFGSMQWWFGESMPLRPFAAGVIIAALIAASVVSDLYYTVCVCMLISAWAKTPTQAVTLGFVATIGPAWVLSCCAWVVQPFVALSLNQKLRHRLREYATR